MTAPAITVVIPTRGRPRLLARALARLGRQTAAAGSYELVVASDAADPDAAATARAVRDGAGPVRARHVQAERRGAAAARNAGWRAGAGALVLFIDDDVLADPPLVAEHIGAHELEPDEGVGVLGDVRWASELRVTPFMRFVERGLQFDYHELRDGADAGWGRFYTANASLKRAALERAGGFDEERFPFGYEDLDLAKRIDGLVLRYRRGASAEHLAPMTLAEWRERVARIARAERAFVERYPDVAPHFHALLSRAAAAPRARGRGARLAAVVPRRTPLLGARVWASAEASYLQDLAPRFLAAWDEDRQTRSSSAGSPPGGPK